MCFSCIQIQRMTTRGQIMATTLALQRRLPKAFPSAHVVLNPRSARPPALRPQERRHSCPESCPHRPQRPSQEAVVTAAEARPQSVSAGTGWALTCPAWPQTLTGPRGAARHQVTDERPSSRSTSAFRPCHPPALPSTLLRATESHLSKVHIGAYPVLPPGGALATSPSTKGDSAPQLTGAPPGSDPHRLD